jgi:hypothetical protein
VSIAIAIAWNASDVVSATSDRNPRWISSWLSVRAPRSVTDADGGLVVVVVGSVATVVDVAGGEEVVVVAANGSDAVVDVADEDVGGSSGWLVEVPLRAEHPAAMSTSTVIALFNAPLPVCRRSMIASQPRLLVQSQRIPHHMLGSIARHSWRTPCAR